MDAILKLFVCNSGGCPVELTGCKTIKMKRNGKGLFLNRFLFSFIGV